MSVEASGGGVSVGTSDRSGGNNAGHEWSIGMHQIEESSGQRLSEEEKKIEESSDHRFREEEKKLFDSFDEALEAVNETGGPTDTKPPKIQKVPYKLRNNEKLKEYFQPKMYSFGPYDTCPRRTRKMANQIKVNLAADFLHQNGVIKEDLYVDINKNQLIKELNDCYNGNLTKTYKDKDHELAWMFLVDGCAILQFMYISVDVWVDPETRFRKLGIKPNYVKFLAQDLFLLENQLPYQLLWLIIQHAKRIKPHTKRDEFYSSTSKEDELVESIYKFIFYRFRSPFEWCGNKDKIWNDLKHDHVHLLDLLRKMLIQPINQIHKKHDFIEIIMGWAAYLFYKLRCNRNGYRVPIQFPNIGKLREAGINLKPSETTCVTDISFIGGTLKLPPIILNESTASTFLNILGYEMCPDFQNKSEFISYMYFLDKLIDQTKDVDELREKNILRHQLGRDEEVAELFNEIGSHLFTNYELYSEVRWKIIEYFNNKVFMWLCKGIHDIHQYFKNRWSLLALIAALLALATGIIQTVYTVLAYHSDSKER